MFLPTSLSHRVKNKWINIFKMVSDCHGVRAQRIEALPGGSEIHFHGEVAILVLVRNMAF